MHCLKVYSPVLSSDDPEASPRTLRQRYAGRKNEPYSMQIRRVSTVLNVTTPIIYTKAHLKFTSKLVKLSQIAR